MLNKPKIQNWGIYNRQSGAGASIVALAANRAMMPATTLSSANYVRQSRLKFTVPSNSNFTNIVVWYPGFGQSSGGEFSSHDDQLIRASIDIGGTNYRSAADVNCPINGFVPVPIPGVTLTAGAQGYIITRALGSAGTTSRIIGHGTHVIFGEGQVSGTNPALDYTDGNYGKDAVAAAPVVTAGNIASCGVAAGGTGYTSGKSVYAYEVQPDGTIAQKTIGNATRTGSAITSITITSGTPPAGVAAWVTPTVVIGNDFSATTQTYGPAFITGTPSNASAKSLLVFLTSIEIGYTSADSIGDLNRNFGIVERGLSNRCGVFNLSSSSQTASSFRSTTTFSKTYAMLSALGISNMYAYMGAPTNDVAGGISEATTESYMNEIKANLAARNILTDFALFLPRTTGTIGAQTPSTGFGTAGIAANLDAKIIAGTIVSTGIGYKDPRTQFADLVNDRLWNTLRTDTTDLIHPNLTGLAYAGGNTSWTDQFSGYA